MPSNTVAATIQPQLGAAQIMMGISGAVQAAQEKHADRKMGQKGLFETQEIAESAEGGPLSSLPDVPKWPDAEKLRQEEALEAMRRDLGLRIHREYRGVTEGVLKIRALEQAVRSNEQLLDSTRKSVLAGVRTQLDVLNVEQQLATTHRDLIQARYLYLMSRLRLQALSGHDPLTALQDIHSAFTP